MQRMWGVKKVFSMFMFLALTVSILLTACGGGGGSDGGGGNNDGGGGGGGVKQGRFIDSSVGGLRYISGSQSGFTNAQGTFSYDEGAIAQFFIGDIVIGGAAANSIMTPVSLVQATADETNPTVTNIARFLQTLDNDGNPSNGITITTAVNNLAVGRTINFNQNIANFGNDTNVQTVVSDLTGVTLAGTRPLVSISSAQNNLRAAILGILSGNYSGTFSGDASGTWTIVIDSSGNISGTAVNSDSSTAAVTGTVGSNGIAIMGIVATGATFSGTITITGQVSGTWVDTSAGESGTFSGSKQ